MYFLPVKIKSEQQSERFVAMVEPSLRKAVELHQEKTGASASEIVRRALREHLKQK